MPKDDVMVERFRDEPDYAVELLNAILEAGQWAELLVVLRQMIEAFGGVETIAEKV